MKKVFKVSLGITWFSTYYFSSEEVAYKTTAFMLQKNMPKSDPEERAKLNYLFQREDYKAYVKTWNQSFEHIQVILEEIPIDPITIESAETHLIIM